MAKEQEVPEGQMTFDMLPEYEIELITYTDTDKYTGFKGLGKFLVEKGNW